MEIQLDINTLPKDQSHIQFQTYASEMYNEWLKGFYSGGIVYGRDNEQYLFQKHIPRWIGQNDQIPRPLEIGS